MKSRIIICIAITLFFLSIPFGSVFFRGNTEPPEIKQYIPTNEYSYDEEANFKIKVYDWTEDKTFETDIFSCITNQIIRDGAENYEDEAIKAIALVIYNDMLYDYEITKKEEIHPDAFICLGCSYCNDISAPEKEINEKNRNRIYSLIEEILTKKITYENKIIQGVKIPFSSGKTESAYDVWGTEIGYLQSKESVWDIQYPNFSNKYVFSISDFYDKCLKIWGVDGEKTKPDIQITDKTENGTVKKVKVFGKEISSNSFCLEFGINSANFSVEVTDSEIIFLTKGSGMSIGLSEYGAECLAEQGYSYEEIIKYYYTDVLIENFSFSEYFLN